MIKVQKGGHEYQVKGMLYKIRKEELWPNLFNFFFFKKDNICWKLRLNFEEDNFRIDFNIFCFYVGQEAGCCSWCCERAREFNILSILRLNPRAPYAHFTPRQASIQLHAHKYARKMIVFASPSTSAKINIDIYINIYIYLYIFLYISIIIMLINGIKVSIVIVIVILTFIMIMIIIKLAIIAKAIYV